jgi:hypothetical protein
MKYLRAFLVLMILASPGDASLLLLRAGGGGGSGCSNSLDFSQSCNSQYLGIGGLL